jgi:hypothetical protein
VICHRWVRNGSTSAVVAGNPAGHLAQLGELHDLTRLNCRPWLQENAQMRGFDPLRPAGPFGKYAAVGEPRGTAANMQL